jgi:hypothetical protein
MAPPVEQLPEVVLLADTVTPPGKPTEALHVLAFATCVVETLGIATSIAPTVIIIA